MAEEQQVQRPLDTELGGDLQSAVTLASIAFAVMTIPVEVSGRLLVSVIFVYAGGLMALYSGVMALVEFVVSRNLRVIDRLLRSVNSSSLLLFAIMLLSIGYVFMLPPFRELLGPFLLSPSQSLMGVTPTPTPRPTPLPTP